MKKTLLLILYICIFSFNAFSQNPLVKQWDKRFGGTSGDELHSIKQTMDGGFILGGWSFSGFSGDKTQGNWDWTHITTDYWIIKIDYAGNKIWDKTFGGINTDGLNTLDQTSDGGYILGGTSISDSSGDKTQSNNDSSSIYYYRGDYWIVKIDSNGTKQWDKTFGGEGVDWLLSVHQTSDGGYILGGFSSSGISGDKSQSSWGGYDYWIIKTDSAGNKLWDKDFGGTDDDNLYSLEKTNDGGFILGGMSMSDSSGDKSKASKGIWDYWILKIDSAGNKMWDKDFGGSDNEFFGFLLQTNDEGYILGGNSMSGISGDKTQDTWGYFDYWIVKIDSTGNKQWDKDFGGTAPEDDFGNIIQTADNGYLIAGTSSSGISGNKTDYNTAGEQTWVVKTDSLGNMQWDKVPHTMPSCCPPPNITEETGYVVNLTDGCYLMANSTPGGIGLEKTQPNYDFLEATRDYWIIKFCDSTTTTNLTPALSKGDGITVYPNPFIDYCELRIGNIEMKKNIDLKVFDIYGGKVFESTIINPQSAIKINLSKFSSGIYILELEGGNIFYKTKLVKQ